MEYESYKEHIAADVAEQIAKLRCQPVLFFGSGMSRRYFNAPNWTELLQKLADDCPVIEQPYAYYAQSCSTEPEVGSIFAESYRQWAWSTGRNQFPDNMFEPNVHPEAFLKYAVANYLKSILSDNQVASLSEPLAEEISALRGIKPHAVLTTNYDTFLEQVFPNYTAVVGQRALKGMPFSVGEIFKFHGCVNSIEEIVLTSEDYQFFSKKKKFIAARLLSLFNEHPLLIAGYGAGDVNVRALLSDIDEALALPGSLIENIYFLEFDPDAEQKPSLPTEKLIQIEDNRSVRVKLIVASDFRWVFRAFESPENLTHIPANILRAILARSYELRTSKNLAILPAA